MRKDRLDEIREKLRLDTLDDKSKRDMFDKFVRAGGEIVDLNKKSKNQIDYKKSDQKRTREASEASPSSHRKKKTSQSKKISVNPVNKWIERFSARVGCYLSGIISFNGENFKNSFRDLLINKYQDTLLNSRMILASVLSQDKLVMNEIRKSSFMDSVFPYNFELIYRFYNLYNEEIFDKLAALRNSLRLVAELKGIMLSIFKSILVVQPYHENLKTALEKALITEKDIRKRDSGITYDNLNKLYNYVDFVFIRLYPRLFSLIDWYYKIDTRSSGVSFKDYLKFANDDTIGYYTYKWKEELSLEAKKEKIEGNDLSGEAAGVKPEPEEMEISDSDPVKKGLLIIEKNIRLRNILAYFSEQHDIRSLFQVRDRVFITLCLIEFFDREFSFIFNSNKVVLNITFIDGKRSDTKRDLLMTYYKINHIMERVNEYLEIIRQIKKLESDSFVSMQERMTRSNQYSLQRSQVSRFMRKEAKEFFEEFSKKLLIVICDYQGNKKIIENPEEILVFDKKIDGSRYAEGKKIIDSIEDAYDFSCSSNFLLTQGDLSSSALILDKSAYLHLDLEQEGDN